MEVDKTSTTILAFVILFAFITAFLAMNTIPEIFKQTGLINQTLMQQHEDEAREKQNQKVFAHFNTEINRLIEYANKSAAQRVIIFNETQNIVEIIENHSAKNLNLTIKNAEKLDKIILLLNISQTSAR